MKRIILLFLLALVFNTSHAQFKRLLQRKAKAAVEQKLKNKEEVSSSSKSENATGMVGSYSDQTDYSDEEFKAELAKKYPNNQAKHDLYYSEYNR